MRKKSNRFVWNSYNKTTVWQPGQLETLNGKENEKPVQVSYIILNPVLKNGKVSIIIIGNIQQMQKPKTDS